MPFPPLFGRWCSGCGRSIWWDELTLTVTKPPVSQMAGDVFDVSERYTVATCVATLFARGDRPVLVGPAQWEPGSGPASSSTSPLKH